MTICTGCGLNEASEKAAAINSDFVFDLCKPCYDLSVQWTEGKLPADSTERPRLESILAGIGREARKHVCSICERIRKNTKSSTMQAKGGSFLISADATVCDECIKELAAFVDTVLATPDGATCTMTPVAVKMFKEMFQSQTIKEVV